MRRLALWIFGIVGAATCSLGLAFGAYALIERWRGYVRAYRL